MKKLLLITLLLTFSIQAQKIGKINGIEIRKPYDTFAFAERVANAGGTLDSLAILDDVLNSLNGTETLVTTVTGYQADTLYSAIGNNFIGTLDIIHSAGYAQLNVPATTNSTNYFIWSNDFTKWTTNDAGTGSGSTITTGYTDSPFGANDATRLQFNLNGGTTVSDQSKIYIFNSITYSETVSFSIWAKTNDASTKTVFIRLGTTDGLHPLTITPTWTRVYYLSANQMNTMEFGLRGGYGTSDSVDISVYGLQVNPGATITDYVATNGTSVTVISSTVSTTVPTGSSNVITTSNGVESSPTAVTPGGTYTLPTGVYEKIIMY